MQTQQRMLTQEEVSTRNRASPRPAVALANELGFGGHPEFEVCRPQGTGQATTERRLVGAAAPAAQTMSLRLRQCSSPEAPLGRRAAPVLLLPDRHVLRERMLADQRLQIGPAIRRPCLWFYRTVSMLAPAQQRCFSGEPHSYCRCKMLEYHASKPGFDFEDWQLHRSLCEPNLESLFTLWADAVVPSPTILDMLADFTRTKSTGTPAMLNVGKGGNNVKKTFSPSP